MKKVLALILALAMIASVAVLSACSSDKKDDKKSDDTSKAASDDAGKADDKPADGGKSYIIYSDNAFAPFEYLDDESGEYVGVDMDIMAAIAEDQGITYEMKNEGFDASMGAVQAGQADAMIAGMTITDERKESFDFSDAYFSDGQVLVVAADSAIKGFEDLNGKTIAAKTSTVGGEYAESLKEQYGFEIHYYEGSNEMYQAVITGADDACIEDFSVIGWAIESEDVQLSIVTEPANVKGYGFAVKKGENAELIEKFNTGLDNIRTNGKYDEILAKYGY